MNAELVQTRTHPIIDIAGFDRHGLIVMKWIPVSADLGEPFDIFRVHRARALRDLPNAWDASGPDSIDIAAHISQLDSTFHRHTTC